MASALPEVAGLLRYLYQSAKSRAAGSLILAAADGTRPQHLPDIGFVGCREIVRQDRLQNRGVIHRRRRRGDCRRERAFHGEGERRAAIGIGIGRRHVGDDLRRRRGGRRGRHRHRRRREQSRRLWIAVRQWHDRGCRRYVGLRRDRLHRRFSRRCHRHRGRRITVGKGKRVSRGALRGSGQASERSPSPSWRPTPSKARALARGECLAPRPVWVPCSLRR